MLTKEQLSELSEHGYTVVKSVLTDTKCSEYTNNIWNFLKKGCDNIDKNDKGTWKYKYWPQNKYGNFVYYIGHEQFMWNIRSNPKILEIFKEIHNTDELKTSFEGINMVKPAEVTKGWNRNQYLYINHPANKSDFECIRGLLLLEDCDKGDHGLTVLDGSHKHYNSYITKNNVKRNSDYVKINDSSWYTKRLCTTRVDILGKKGDLILYNSKLASYMKSSNKKRKNKNRFHVSIKLSFRPMNEFTGNQLERRQEYYEKLEMTNFIGCTKSQSIPYRYDTMFSYTPEEPILNDTMKKLI